MSYLCFIICLYLCGCARSQLQHVGSSSLTRDGTRAPCVGRMESQPVDHQGRSPSYLYLTQICFTMTSTHQFQFFHLVQPEPTKPCFHIAAFSIFEDNYKVPSSFLFSGLKFKLVLILQEFYGFWTQAQACQLPVELFYLNCIQNEKCSAVNNQQSTDLSDKILRMTASFVLPTVHVQNFSRQSRWESCEQSIVGFQERKGTCSVVKDRGGLLEGGSVCSRHLKMGRIGTSLVAQQLRIYLAIQGTQVRSLVRELRSHMLWSY